MTFVILHNKQLKCEFYFSNVAKIKVYL